MVSITAVIRGRAGREDTMAQALLDVARHVRDGEPDTRAFLVSRDAGDPRVFTTYERFTDTAAMDTHNNSAAVARFFATVKPILDGEVVLHICEEVWATYGPPRLGSVRQAEPVKPFVNVTFERIIAPSSMLPSARGARGRDWGEC